MVSLERNLVRTQHIKIGKDWKKWKKKLHIGILNTPQVKIPGKKILVVQTGVEPLTPQVKL